MESDELLPPPAPYPLPTNPDGSPLEQSEFVVARINQAIALLTAARDEVDSTYVHATTIYDEMEARAEANPTRAMHQTHEEFKASQHLRYVVWSISASCASLEDDRDRLEELEHELDGNIADANAALRDGNVEAMNEAAEAAMEKADFAQEVAATAEDTMMEIMMAGEVITPPESEEEVLNSDAAALAAAGHGVVQDDPP